MTASVAKTKTQRITVEAFEKLLEMAAAHRRQPVQEASLIIEQEWARWKEGE